MKYYFLLVLFLWGNNLFAQTQIIKGNDNLQAGGDINQEIINITNNYYPNNTNNNYENKINNKIRKTNDSIITEAINYFTKNQDLKKKKPTILIFPFYQHLNGNSIDFGATLYNRFEDEIIKDSLNILVFYLGDKFSIPQNEYPKFCNAVSDALVTNFAIRGESLRIDNTNSTNVKAALITHIDDSKKQYYKLPFFANTPSNNNYGRFDTYYDEENGRIINDTALFKQSLIINEQIEFIFNYLAAISNYPYNPNYNIKKAKLQLKYIHKALIINDNNIVCNMLYLYNSQENEDIKMKFRENKINSNSISNGQKAKLFDYYIRKKEYEKAFNLKNKFSRSIISNYHNLYLKIADLHLVLKKYDEAIIFVDSAINIITYTYINTDFNCSFDNEYIYKINIDILNAIKAKSYEENENYKLAIKFYEISDANIYAFDRSNKREINKIFELNTTNYYYEMFKSKLNLSYCKYKAGEVIYLSNGTFFGMKIPLLIDSISYNNEDDSFNDFHELYKKSAFDNFADFIINFRIYCDYNNFKFTKKEKEKFDKLKNIFKFDIQFIKRNDFYFQNELEFAEKYINNNIIDDE